MSEEKQMTPLKELIEWIEKMPAFKYEPIVIGIHERAKSLLPKEKSVIIESHDSEDHDLCGCNSENCDYCAEIDNRSPLNGEQYFNSKYTQ